MRSQKGFTLIELIIVIVVLGILAVTAAPQFIDFSTDARTSTIKGLKGAAKGASQSVYGKAVIEGKESDGTATLTDPSVTLVYGYPDASSTGILAALNIDTQDWSSQEIASGQATPSELAEGDLFIYPEGRTIDYTSQTTFEDTGCGVIYTEAASNGAQPSIVAFTTGC